MRVYVVYVCVYVDVLFNGTRLTTCVERKNVKTLAFRASRRIKTPSRPRQLLQRARPRTEIVFFFSARYFNDNRELECLPDVNSITEKYSENFTRKK